MRSGVGEAVLDFVYVHGRTEQALRNADRAESVEVGRARPMIEDALFNVSWVPDLGESVQGYFDAFLRRTAYFRKPWEGLSFHLATRILRCMQPPTTWRLHWRDRDVRDDEYHISKGCLQPHCHHLFPPRLFPPGPPPPQPRLVRLSAQHLTPGARVVRNVVYPGYDVLIDTRGEIDPFSRLLDALIFRFTAYKQDFWSSVRKHVTNGETTLSLEQKIQLVVHLLLYQEGLTIRASFLHEGPCFATDWKANLDGFSSLLRTVRFRFLHFTYECMRVDFTTGVSFVRVLDKQQRSFAFKVGFVPRNGLSNLERYEYDSQLIGTGGRMQGTGACARPDESKATVDWQMIDSPRLRPDDVANVIEGSAVTVQVWDTHLVEYFFRASRASRWSRNIKPVQAPINSRFMGGCPVSIYHG